MTISFNQTDKYVAIQLKSAEITHADVQQILEMTERFLDKGKTNFILVPGKAGEDNENARSLVKELNSIINENEGILVVAKPSDPWTTMLEEHQISYTHSFDEAVDYVFIEDLEKGFAAQAADDADDEVEDFDDDDIDDDDFEIDDDDIDDDIDDLFKDDDEEDDDDDWR